MLKSFKLSYKIAFGVGVILTIAAILGIVAVISMSSATGRASNLSKKYTPQVEVANNIERNTLNFMFNIRGYILSGDTKYLELGNGFLDKAFEYLKSARDLSDKYPELVKLKEQVSILDADLNNYKKLLEDTVSINASVAEKKKNIDGAKNIFIKNYSDYKNDENKNLINVINSGADKTAVTASLWKVNTINEIGALFDDINGGYLEVLSTKNYSLLNDSLKNFETIDKLIAAVKAKTAQQINIEELNSIAAASQDYQNSVRDFLVLEPKLDELKKNRETVANNITASAEETSVEGIRKTMAEAKSTTSSLSISSVILVVGLIIAIILGLLIGLYLVKAITKPLMKAVGNLTEGAQQVAAASDQLSAASQQLAEANSEQAASIEETSATLEQSSAMVQQNNENTKQAAMLAGQAKASADKGNEKMSEMMDSMTEIKKSSDQISKIIKVIDEIAFQTNILALNAAVEAARAGEAGMGFAVVAEEVRNLAQRSAQAAKDTASIIENNIEMSVKGVEVAKKVGESLTEITVQSKKVNELMDEVAAASQEQSLGISQINKAISQMEKATQENAATAEESAASSEELSAQAETMKEIVGDLVKLVEGENANLNSLRGSYKSGVKAANSVGKAKGFKQPSYTTNVKTYNKAPGVSPSEVIPLEDGNDDF